MAMMPLSTYKPPTFGLIEDYFNDAQWGLLRRWTALLKLASLPNPEQFDPSGGVNGRLAPVEERQIEHFNDHWIASGGTGGWYWPNFQYFEPEIRRRLVRGFVDALAFSVLPNGPDFSVLSTPKNLLKMHDYPSLDLLWVCSNPDPNAAEFLVRPLVYECEVNVIFLTPWPKGIAMPPGGGLSGPNAGETVVAGESVDPEDFPDPETLAAANEEVVDTAKGKAKTGVPTCCPRWTLNAPAQLFGVDALASFIEGIVQPQTAVVARAPEAEGESDPVDVNAGAVAEAMIAVAENPLFLASGRAAFLEENGVAELLAREPLTLGDPPVSPVT